MYSQPKYWCKHCKTFVRDTKLERTNHEATPKHQGNIKRFLRDLHRGHEKDEREKQRAKDEVERLNGVVAGAPTSASASGEAPWRRKSAIPPSSGPRQATPAERKAQLAQLAAMGVAVPEDFRREMAMAGDWQTISQKPVYENVEKKEDTNDVKPSLVTGDPSKISIGVRKRKFDGQEEEEEAGEKVVRKGWGSKLRAYPGASNDLTLDALLNKTKLPAPSDTGLGDDQGETLPSISGEQPHDILDKEVTATLATTAIKREDSQTYDGLASLNPSVDGQDVKDEDEVPPGGIVFKKRKAKPIRQK